MIVKKLTFVEFMVYLNALKANGLMSDEDLINEEDEEEGDELEDNQ